MKKVKFFHWKKCSTCRNAKAVLVDMGVELEERDFFQLPLSKEELLDILVGRSAGDIFSWNSPSFKKLGLARENLSDGDLIEMMLNEPRFIRRPLITVGNQLVVGLNKDGLTKLLA